MAAPFQGSERGRVQLARRTKDEQVPICRDQVSLQSTSRQSFCPTDLAEPGDAHRFGTEIIGVRTSMHHYHNVVEQFWRKHRQTHAHAHAYADARARARACELELVHVSLNSLTLFFVRAVGFCMCFELFLSYPFLLSFFLFPNR